ncbi:exodeoxyribonuclease 7 small subunit [Propionigenium maris DSM 9537]|uniref:Exodeoxyribonuclease 7 small subunit n=1 Tax=Propionigenium maris DSM 9537 TaxID=1123000 RepID=A0A9W6GM30_9FUSO|nr:exodeoxyribonuclease VII small subunit [Propionigenium maris]GLI56067.1 exodeoxyribonuclease 7 small subunit [Propionigenium maris DSM 9537]
MARAKSFEENLMEVDEIIKKLENGELELADSLKEYEKATKLLKKSSELLEKAEGKIMKVVEEAGEIKIENFEAE